MGLSRDSPRFAFAGNTGASLFPSPTRACRKAAKPSPLNAATPDLSMVTSMGTASTLVAEALKMGAEKRVRKKRHYDVLTVVAPTPLRMP